jgi:hypothetical protein
MTANPRTMSEPIPNPFPVDTFDGLRAALRRLIREVQTSGMIRDLNFDDVADARLSYESGEGLQVTAWHGPRDRPDGAPVLFVTVSRVRVLRVRAAWGTVRGATLADVAAQADALAAFRSFGHLADAFATLAGLTMDGGA